jgi:tRNA(fMet)-specific endonuclease VapC
MFLITVETIPFGTLAALEYGRIRAALRRLGTPISDHDMLIAAHAKAEGLTIVTNNVREFGRVEGLAVEDWLA